MIVRLGWIGTPSTTRALAGISSQLKELFATHDNLELRIVGGDDKLLKKHLVDIPYSLLASYSESEMIREAVGMDIGLFPAPGDLDDYRLRGPLKALIYMSASIPPVCLKAGEPARIIRDGFNGVLIDSPGDWITKVGNLVSDKSRRIEIGTRAFETVKNKHSLKSAFNDLELAFMEVIKREPMVKPRYPRGFGPWLLKRVTNVYDMFWFYAGKCVQLLLGNR